MSDFTVGDLWICKSNSNYVVRIAKLLPDNEAIQYLDDDNYKTTLSIKEFVGDFQFHDNPDTHKHDAVNHPSHYTSGQVECIDAIRAALTDEEFRGFCKGNVLKYTWREKHKGGNESLKKAIWYLEQLSGAADD